MRRHLPHCSQGSPWRPRDWLDRHGAYSQARGQPGKGPGAIFALEKERVRQKDCGDALEGIVDMVEDLQNRARIRAPENLAVTNFYPLEPDVPSSDRSKKNSFRVEITLIKIAWSASQSWKDSEQIQKRPCKSGPV